jgi:hypothetical protein
MSRKSQGSKAWRQVSYHLDARKLFFNNESHMMLPPPSPLVQCSLISFRLFFRVRVLLFSSSFSLSSVSVFCRLLLLLPCFFLSPTTFLIRFSNNFIFSLPCSFYSFRSNCSTLFSLLQLLPPPICDVL